MTTIAILRDLPRLQILLAREVCEVVARSTKFKTKRLGLWSFHFATPKLIGTMLKFFILFKKSFPPGTYTFFSQTQIKKSQLHIFHLHKQMKIPNSMFICTSTLRVEQLFFEMGFRLLGHLSCPQVCTQSANMNSIIEIL